MDSQDEFFSHRITALFGPTATASGSSSSSLTTTTTCSKNEMTTTPTSATAEIVQRLLAKFPVSSLKFPSSSSRPTTKRNCSTEIATTASSSSKPPASTQRLLFQTRKSNKLDKTKPKAKAKPTHASGTIKKNSSFSIDQLYRSISIVSSLSIKYRSVSGEKLLESFKNLEKLRKVVISNCTLREETLPEGLFKNCKELRHLFLTNNACIKRLEANVFQNLKSMHSLHLCVNQLEVLHEVTFQNCVNLCHLDLSNNSLRCLSENIFSSCKNLKTLCLANNQIETLERNVLCELRSLNDFNIACNRLKSLEAEIFDNCLEINKIDISNNDGVDIGENFVVQLVGLILYNFKGF
jgi:Leucine-rich repeat (LRR) protein